MPSKRESRSNLICAREISRQASRLAAGHMRTRRCQSIESLSHLAPSCSVPLVSNLSASRNQKRQRTDKRVLTTSLSGCLGSGPFPLLFFAASWLESFPAAGFNSFVPLRCSCTTPHKSEDLIPQSQPEEQETDRLFPPLRSFQGRQARVERHAILPARTLTTQRPRYPDNLVSSFNRSRP